MLCGVDLELLQVISSLTFCRAHETVSMTFDFLVASHRDASTKLLLVHRGLALLNPRCGTLLTCSPRRPPLSYGQGRISRDYILRTIYDKHIKMDRGRVGYKEHQNWLVLRNSATWLDYVAPHTMDYIPYYVTESALSFPPLSAFYASNLLPGISWFRVSLSISGVTYDELVKIGPHFGIEGPLRAKNRIADEDIPLRSYLQPGVKEFFDSKIERQVLVPRAYDVVIFRPGAEGCDVDTVCKPLTGDVHLRQVDDLLLQDKAHLFVSQSSEFWIEVSYTNSTHEPDDITGQRNAETLIYV